MSDHATSAERKPRTRYNKAMRTYADKRSAQARQRVAEYLAKAVRIATDVNNENRHAVGQCVACYYLPTGHIVGHMFTAWVCQSCGADAQHHNTGVPRYCIRCAHSIGMCITCGGHARWTGGAPL